MSPSPSVAPATVQGLQSSSRSDPIADLAAAGVHPVVPVVAVWSHAPTLRDRKAIAVHVNAARSSVDGRSLCGGRVGRCRDVATSPHLAARVERAIAVPQVRIDAAAPDRRVVGAGRGDSHDTCQHRDVSARPRCLHASPTVCARRDVPAQTNQIGVPRPQTHASQATLWGENSASLATARWSTVSEGVGIVNQILGDCAASVSLPGLRMT